MLSARTQLDDLNELTAKYEPLSLLGSGAVGRVLCARHRQLKELVAIKLLQHDLTSAESRARFLREARAAARIRSSHVARVMDAGVLDDGRPYIVMEHLEGVDLAALLQAEGPLTAERAAGYMLESLEALAEAHALGIVHRDIKPGNLFAAKLPGGEISIKVLDFGLAKTAADFDSFDPQLTAHGGMLGTPSYMAPEQFLNAGAVDARADIWAAGATLFELLTGTAPFSGATLPQLYAAVVHAPIKRLRSVVPSLPEGLEAVIDRCLCRERAQRFANVAELARGLEPFAGVNASRLVERITRLAAADTSSAAPVPTTVTLAVAATESNLDTRPAPSRSRRRRGIARALATLAVLVLSLVAWAAWAGDATEVAPLTAAELPRPASVIDAVEADGAVEDSLVRAITVTTAPVLPSRAMDLTPQTKRSNSRRRARVTPVDANKETPSPAAPSIYEKYP